VLLFNLAHCAPVGQGEPALEPGVGGGGEDLAPGYPPRGIHGAQGNCLCDSESGKSARCNKEEQGLRERLQSETEEVKEIYERENGSIK